MSGDYYRTAAEEAAETGDIALHQAIHKADPQGAARKLVGVFLHSLGWHNDKQSKKYLDLLLRAISDIELVPFLEKGDGVYNPANANVLPHGSSYSTGTEKEREIAAAKDRAWKARAAKAVGLWPTLPKNRPSKIRVHIAQDESVLQDSTAPTLVETKKALLAEVAMRWARTTDDSEADELLSFLLQASDPGIGSDDLLDVMRKAADAQISLRRIERFLVNSVGPKEKRLAPYNSHLFSGLFGRLMAMAWGKKSDLDRISCILEAAEPLREADAPAYELSRSLNEKVAELVKIGDSLRLALCRTPNGLGFINKEGFFHPSSVSISYAALDSLRVTISHSGTPGYAAPQETWCDDQYHKAVEKIREWKDGCSTRVTLVFSVKDGYNKEVFAKTRDF